MSEQISQLRQLANAAHEYQLEREWSDARLCREIAHLGSTKTFKRILDPEDPLDELNIENQIRAYENAVEFITQKRAKDRPAEPEYEDFENIKEVRQAVAAALQEEATNVARFVCIEGENGTGKDASIKVLARKWSKIVVVCEAHELWRDSLAVPLADLINSLDVRRREEGQGFQMPNFPHKRMEVLEQELNRRKIVLVINEFHHMGPRALNLMKWIVNRSPTVLVGFCIPVLLNRLIKSGYEEAAQLFGNRLCRRVRLEPPGESEIIELCERRGIKFADSATANVFAKAVADDAPGLGNWRFVVRTARKVRELGTAPVNTQKLSDCLNRARRECIFRQNAPISIKQ